jgi:hypothetical protein
MITTCSPTAASIVGRIMDAAGREPLIDDAVLSH